MENEKIEELEKENALLKSIIQKDIETSIKKTKKKIAKEVKRLSLEEAIEFLELLLIEKKKINEEAE